MDEYLVPTEAYGPANAKQEHVVIGQSLGVGWSVGFSRNQVLVHGRPLPVGHGLPTPGLDLDCGPHTQQHLSAGKRHFDQVWLSESSGKGQKGRRLLPDCKWRF